MRAAWAISLVLLPQLGAQSAHARTAPTKGPAHPVIDATFRTPVIEGRMDSRLARRVIRRKYRALRLCYEMALHKRPDIAGTAKLTFEIDERGQVTNATAAGVDPDVDACLSGLARRWQFSRPAHGTVKITQVMSFASRR